MPANERAPGARWRAALLAPGCWPTWAGLALLYPFSLLPRRLRFALAGLIGAAALRLDRQHRHYAEVNLAHCYASRPPAERERLLREYFRRYLQILLDLPLLWWGSRRQLRRRLRVEGREHLDAALAGGRAVILLTGHSIALDFGVLALNAHYPMFSVYNPFKNPVADWLMYRARTRFGLGLAAREEGMRPVLRAVRGGAVLYYIPDEDLGPVHSVFAPFFGVPKATLSALGRLASLCRAEVIPCTTCYHDEDGSYRVSLRPALTDFPTGSESEDAARMNQALEALIASCPAQYMWGLRMFKTRPQGQPRFYRKLRYPWSAALRRIRK